jgi:hypothetical protein
MNIQRETEVIRICKPSCFPFTRQIPLVTQKEQYLGLPQYRLQIGPSFVHRSVAVLLTLR